MVELDMADMRWKVREYLDQHGLSAGALVYKTHGKLAPNTVYALARGEPKRVALATMAEVVAALREMTGEEVTASDLLEYVS